MPLGIVEGVHAAMFDSSDEFEDKVHYYLRHEGERLAIVKAARELALSHHLWSHRATEVVGHIREALDDYWKRHGGAG